MSTSRETPPTCRRARPQREGGANTSPTHFWCCPVHFNPPRFRSLKHLLPYKCKKQLTFLPEAEIEHLDDFSKRRQWTCTFHMKSANVYCVFNSNFKCHREINLTALFWNPWLWWRHQRRLIFARLVAVLFSTWTPRGRCCRVFCVKSAHRAFAADRLSLCSLIIVSETWLYLHKDRSIIIIPQFYSRTRVQLARRIKHVPFKSLALNYRLHWTTQLYIT